MKILIYGGGSIGSLYAVKLKEAGNDVAILARGTRLKEIHEHGILLQEFRSGQQTNTRVDAVEQLAPAESYDLVLVILPRQSVSDLLPILAANQNTPSVMFMGNNASGPDEMIDSLDRDRVLLGFPGAAAISDGVTIQYLILDRREQPTTIGELDGSKSARITAIANAFESAGFPCATCMHMDAWLKTHVAEISPTANALYTAGGNLDQLKRNRETLVLMLRAIREGYRVLTALGIPITPPSHNVFRWIPRFLWSPSRGASSTRQPRVSRSGTRLLHKTRCGKSRTNSVNWLSGRESLHQRLINSESTTAMSQRIGDNPQRESTSAAEVCRPASSTDATHRLLKTDIKPDEDLIENYLPQVLAAEGESLSSVFRRRTDNDSVRCAPCRCEQQLLQIDDAPMTVLLCSMTLFVLLSGLMSAVEAAVLSVTRPEVDELIRRGERGAVRLQEVRQNLTQSLAVLVILTNLVNVVGPILVSQRAFGLYGRGAFLPITVVLTLGTIVFSEVIPKSLGWHYAPQLARWAAPFIRVVAFVLYPLGAPLARLSDVLLRGERRIGTEEQIRALVRLGRQGGHIEADEGHMIFRTFRLNDRRADAIMTPLENVASIPASATVREAEAIAHDRRFSRFPLFGKSADEVPGVVIAREVFRELALGQADQPVTSLAHPPFIVEAETRADELLMRFRTLHQHLAVVQDNGRTIGIVTLEDVLEEIVGEIEDEKDIGLRY